MTIIMYECIFSSSFPVLHYQVLVPALLSLSLSSHLSVCPSQTCVDLTLDQSIYCFLPLVFSGWVFADQFRVRVQL